MLSVHLLESDDPLAADYFFKSLADIDQKRDLYLCLRDPCQHVQLVVRCLEEWIFQEGVERGLEQVLERYFEAEVPNEGGS